MKKTTKDRSRAQGIMIDAARMGYNMRRAARAGRVHRATLYRWLETDPLFAKQFMAAWAHGTARRDYQKWLSHPFRGYRPPTGKGTRAFPRYGKRRCG